MTQINYKNGIVNRGNATRIKKVMKKAKEGGEVNLSFLGGSITQGAASSRPETCYAYLIYEWWKKTFPDAGFQYNNAGIGGTTSQFGAARVEADVLSTKVDFVIVEYSVNDSKTDHFMETYEGLIRRIYYSEAKPAILIVHNVTYDDGKSAEDLHKIIGAHYDIPCISMRSTIYEEVKKGTIEKEEITADDLHPNDRGHEMLANVIAYYLKKISLEIEINEDQLGVSKEHKAFTRNRYQHSFRYQANSCTPICHGFWEDRDRKTNIADCFKHGWKAKEKGAKILFELEGEGLAVQYRKTKDKPAPVARLVLDDNREKAVILDANFDEDWGDLLELTTVAKDLEKRKHKIEIEIIETHVDDQKEFYLGSIIMN